MPETSSNSKNRQGLVNFIANLPVIRRGKIIKELVLGKLDTLDEKTNILDEKTNILDEKTNILDEKTNILLKNDTPLLQISLAIIKVLQSIKRDSRELDSKVNQLANQLNESIEKVFNAVVDSKSKVIQLKDGLVNPEVSLMCYLYSYLPSRRLIDIGANIGETSEYLLKAGYEVYAFEPFPAVFQKLNDRLENNPNFYSFPTAIGADNTSKKLHIACDQSESSIYEDATLYNSLVKHSMLDDLLFIDTINVNVRSLADLHDSQEIPVDIGLVKIDTEGYDIEVIRGMGDYRYPVVVAEFWDEKFPFGRFGAMNQLEGLVDIMKTKDYHWYIVFYRLWDGNQWNFYCNYPQSAENSWGNVFFFQDYGLFSKALMWCSATLSETYIKSGSEKVYAG